MGASTSPNFVPAGPAAKRSLEWKALVASSTVESWDSLQPALTSPQLARPATQSVMVLYKGGEYLGVSLVSYMLKFWNTLLNFIMKWCFDKIILLNLDLIGPLMTDPVSANYTNFHYIPIMCNYQDSASINTYPPDTHPIHYGQPSLWLYVQLKEHPPLDNIHISLTLNCCNFLPNHAILK